MHWMSRIQLMPIINSSRRGAYAFQQAEGKAISAVRAEIAAIMHALLEHPPALRASAAIASKRSRRHSPDKAVRKRALSRP